MFLLALPSVIAPGQNITLEGDYSINPEDFDFWDDGDQIKNGTFSAAPANQSLLTSQRWTAGLASLPYTSGADKFGNMSINFSSPVNQEAIFDFGEEKSDVTVEIVFFDNKVDTSANAQIFFEADTGTDIFKIGLVTVTSSTHYVCDNGCASTTTDIARVDGGVNFTVYIAAGNAYAELYVNHTLVFNDTTIAGGIRQIKLQVLTEIDAQVDEIKMWPGPPENKPLAPDPTPPTYSNFKKNITDANIRVDSAIEFNITITDADNAVKYWNFSWNATPGDTWNNVTNSTDLTDPSQSNNSLSGTVGDIIGYMFCSSDDQGNVGCDTERTFEILASNTCTYSSGDWSIDASDDCVISTAVNVEGNDVIITGSGTVTITSTGSIENFEELAVHGSAAELSCRNTGGCFG